MSNKIVNSLSLAVGAALLGSVTLASAASAFQVQDLGQGYMLVGEEKPEGKCGEGKCGGAKGKEGSCGEGGHEAAAEGEDKGKEGSCGGSH